jgi:8-oxo-dGTP pyrophosphatase MutT (NUDIX family)
MRRAFSIAVYPRHGDRLLLIHHRRLAKWLPPGGELEPGETPLEAAARELFEETGLQGTFPPTSDVDGAPPGLIGYEEHVAGSKGLHLNFVFVCDVPTTSVVPNAEFSAFRWVTLDDGPWAEAPPNVRQLAVLALRAGR